jgi:hypothetical protein
LGIKCEIIIWLVFVLVALDVENIDRDWELLNKGVDGLDDIILVLGQEVEGGGLGSDKAK